MQGAKSNYGRLEKQPQIFQTASPSSATSHSTQAKKNLNMFLMYAKKVLQITLMRRSTLSEKASGSRPKDW